MARQISNLIFPCLGLRNPPENARIHYDHRQTPLYDTSTRFSTFTPTYCDFPSEKIMTYSPTHQDAQKVLTRLLHAPTGIDITTFQDDLRGTIDASSWTESLAETILQHLETIFRAGTELTGAMKDIVERVADKAWEFSKDHPVYITIIALGVLALTLPWVLEALGFAEAGIVEGSFAAWWQARYAGYVPKGSLFALLQSLGTKLHWMLVE